MWMTGNFRARFSQNLRWLIWLLSLTKYNMQLVDTYLSIPYVETKCGYACSDQYVFLLHLSHLVLIYILQCILDQGWVSIHLYHW